jgi:FkbM family methyltransferase
MFKKIIKSIPGAKSINSILLQKKIQNQFLRLNETEQFQLTFYSQFINNGDLVFDVGANVGSRSKLFLNLGAKVVAFEPQPELCDHLTQNLRLHNRFTPMPIGLGANPSIVELKISDAHVLSSMSNRWIESTTQSGRFSSYNWDKSIDVKVDTIDNMINKFGIPKFVKIDVEGYELEVLQGLSHQIKYLSFEFTAEDIDATCSCINHLAKFGPYLFKFSKGESFLFEMNQWESIKKFRTMLLNLVNKDNLAWGDIYAMKKPA